MSTEPTDGDRDAITQKLEDLGVSTTPDEVEEIAVAYPALKAWIRLVEELARDESA